MGIWNLNELDPPDGHVLGKGRFKGRKSYRVAETGVTFMEPKRINYQERPVAFLDIETSGTDPRWADILEIGIVRTDEPEPLELKLPLINPQRAEEEALAIVGYTEKEWEDAVPWGFVAQQVWDKLAVGSPAIVGHNLFRFDWPVLEWRLRAMGFPTHLIGRPLIDTLSLAFAHFHGQPDAPANLSLESLCVYYQINPEGVHRALGGARRCRQIYERLCGH